MAGIIKLTVQDYIATVVMDRPPVNAQNSRIPRGNDRACSIR